MLYMRTLESRAVGIRAPSEPPRTRPGLHAVCHVELYHSLSADAGGRRSGCQYGRLQFPRAQPSEPDPFWGERPDSCFSIWTMVDIPEPAIGARRCFAHPVQHDFDPADRAGDMLEVRREP